MPIFVKLGSTNRKFKVNRLKSSKLNFFLQKLIFLSSFKIYYSTD